MCHLESNKGVDEAAGKKLSTVETEKRLLEETNEKTMRKYGAQNSVVRKGVGKPIKSVPVCFVGKAMCISGVIPKCCRREISEQDYFSEDMRRNWTRCSEQSSGGGI